MAMPSTRSAAESIVDREGRHRGRLFWVFPEAANQPAI